MDEVQRKFNIILRILAIAFFSHVCHSQKIDYSRWSWMELSGNCTSANDVSNIVDHIEENPHLKFIEHRRGIISFLVSPKYTKRDITNIIQPGCRVETIYSTLDSLLKEELHRKRVRRRAVNENDYFDKYLTHKEMNQFYKLLEQNFPSTLKKKVIGKSFEGRDIVMFIISNQLSKRFNCYNAVNGNALVETFSSNDGLKSRNLELVKKSDSHFNRRRISQSKRMRWNPKLRRMISRARRKSKANNLQDQQKRIRKHLYNRKRHNQAISLEDRTSSNNIWRLPAPRRAFPYNRRRATRRIGSKGNFRKKRNANVESDSHKHIYLNLENILGAARPKEKEKKRYSAKEKPVVFIESGAHPREWIAPAASLYLIWMLAAHPHLSDVVEYRVVPMLNPDGYIFSRKSDRMWRKTRSKTGHYRCRGVDLNRNFGNHWGEKDTSRNPCKPHYGGSQEFSEPESRAVRDEIYKIRHRVKAYLTIHNWGQEIMSPFSYTTKETPWNMEYLTKHSKGMAREIFSSQKVNYTTGMSSVQLYPASGTSLDWAHETVGIPLSYILELRDAGKKHFLIPPEEIRPTGEDLFAAVKYIGRVVGEEAYKQCQTFQPG